MTAIAAVGFPRLSGRLVRSTASGRPVSRRADSLLWALALMHVTYVWRLPSIVSALKPLHLGIVSGGLALALFLLDRSPRRRLTDLPMMPVRLTVALLALMALSVPAGLYPLNSGMYLLQNVIPALLLMVMLATSMRSLADIEWFAKVNMYAAAGYCLFVFWVFRVGHDGRLEELIYYDGNDLALLLVATLPTAGYFVARGRRLTQQALAGLCALLYLVLLVRTGSRGAFVGLIPVAAYIALFYRGFSRIKRLATVWVMGFVFVVLGGASYFSKIETLLKPTSDYNWSGQSPTGRLEIWKRGVGYLADHPLFGVGVNNFARAEGNLSEFGRAQQSRGLPFKWSVAHNSYLETGVEAGIGALVVFLGLFAVTLLLLQRVVRTAKRLPYVSRELVLAQTLGAALVGYMVCAFFISAEYFVYPYVLLGLAIALAKTTLPRGGATSRVR